MKTIRSRRMRCSSETTIRSPRSWPRLVHAELLILLSDIDGLFTDDPHQCKNARFISLVENLGRQADADGKGEQQQRGDRSMATKLSAAKIATSAGADMLIANGEDFHIIHRIMNGLNYGTLFLQKKNEHFHLIDYLRKNVEKGKKPYGPKKDRENQ